MAEVGNMALPAKILKKGFEVSFYPIGSTNSIDFLGCTSVTLIIFDVHIRIWSEYRMLECPVQLLAR